jgi:hypothetical protein
LRLRSDDLHWQAVEGEVLALDARTQVYLAVNKSGAVLWDLLARGTSRAELIERLVSQYDLAPDRAAGDVDRILNELSAKGLLADAERVVGART